MRRTAVLGLLLAVPAACMTTGCAERAQPVAAATPATRPAYWGRPATPQMLAARPTDPPLPYMLGRCWKLSWNDEFDGNALDPAKWTPVKDGPRGPGFWRGDHVRVHDGVAEFLVTRENGKYVSAGTSTEQRFSAKGGYFVIRAKLPTASGFRPAFWLSSEIINTVNDPRHPTEIDVLEYPARDGRIRQNLHWNGYAAYHQTVGNANPDIVDPSEYHTFGVWWNEQGYRFYVDGRPTWQSAAGGISQIPEFMRLGDEILPEDKFLPQPSDAELAAGPNFTVDYVRVYQPGNCP